MRENFCLTEYRTGRKSTYGGEKCTFGGVWLENGSFMAASIQLSRNRVFGMTAGKGQEPWVWSFMHSHIRQKKANMGHPPEPGSDEVAAT
jgi:hypothetical protein